VTDLTSIIAKLEEARRLPGRWRLLTGSAGAGYLATATAHGWGSPLVRSERGVADVGELAKLLEDRRRLSGQWRPKSKRRPSQWAEFWQDAKTDVSFWFISCFAAFMLLTAGVFLALLLSALTNRAYHNVPLTLPYERRLSTPTR